MLKTLVNVKAIINVFLLTLNFFMFASLIIVYFSLEHAMPSAVSGFIFAIKNALIAPLTVMKNIFIPSLPATFPIGPGKLDPLIALGFVIYLVIQIVIETVLSEIIKIQRNKFDRTEDDPYNKRRVHYGNWD